MHTNEKITKSEKITMVTKMTELRKTGPIILIYFSGQLTQTLKDDCHVCRIPGTAFVLELEAKNGECQFRQNL